MILVTGGAGFIGSNLINFIQASTDEKVVSVDWKNLKNSHYFISDSITTISPTNLKSFLSKYGKTISIVIHLGAITSTTEMNANLIVENNIRVSVFLWNWCFKKKKRFIYASSAATYGNGENKFIDSEDQKYLNKLLPLNLYGWSKHVFDQFVRRKKLENLTPPQCVGLKFFNVYGPNEEHKGEMKSIVLKIFQKLKKNSTIKLFKSHNPNYRNGEQLRDFIYVKDAVAVINWFMLNPNLNGLYNVGSGVPRTFNDLAISVLKNCNCEKKIMYINTPKDIREQYQYFTKANTNKLRKTGFRKDFHSLENGVTDYIRHLNSTQL